MNTPTTPPVPAAPAPSATAILTEIDALVNQAQAFAPLVAGILGMLGINATVQQVGKILVDIGTVLENA